MSDDTAKLIERLEEYVSDEGLDDDLREVLEQAVTALRAIPAEAEKPAK